MLFLAEKEKCMKYSQTRCPSNIGIYQYPSPPRFFFYINEFNANHNMWNILVYALLKSGVTIRDHVVRCRASQECGSRFVNFACKWRWHSFRITLKSKHCCSCAVVMCEPGNRDNGASDVWALTAYT